jgi:hypothetical protein
MTSDELAKMLDGYIKQYPDLLAEVKALEAQYTVVKPEAPVRPTALRSITRNENGTNGDE